jgi:hypothetical protein
MGNASVANAENTDAMNIVSNNRIKNSSGEHKKAVRNVKDKYDDNNYEDLEENI